MLRVSFNNFCKISSASENVQTISIAPDRSGDIELVPVGVDDGDYLVHVRRRRQVLGENEEVSAQHAGGGVEGGETALQTQRQQKSKLATTVKSFFFTLLFS